MILLVDGTALACRLWWANAKGVTGRFARVIERFRAAEVRVAFDSGPSWRREILATYKSGRKPKPVALVEAIAEVTAECKPWATNTGCSRALVQGYEADDILATWARAAAGPVAILGDDKDLCQLVGPGCVMVSAAGEVLDASGVVDRLGVAPDRVRHLLSWTGDRVDGLPGVPGYGPKRGAERARRGEIGNRLTYDLAELVTVPGLQSESPPAQESGATAFCDPGRS